METVSHIIKYLSNPYLVSKTQTLFGLKLNQVVKDQEFEQLDSSKLKKIKSVSCLNDEKCLYTIENKLFYYFFLFITHMGNEVFYILFLPILTWAYNDNIMFLTCIAWSITMYIGQATKDILKIPRPQTPPVVKIEDKYLLEYGFPSTHAMASLSISYTLLNLLFQQDHKLDFKIFLILIAFFSAFFVCLSRIYLGMHSYLDIIGGLIFSFFINLIFVKYSSFFLDLIEHSLASGLLTSLFYLLICFFYPNKTRWSPARADTFLIMGVATGITLGMSIKATFGLDKIGKLSTNNFSLNLKRTLVGVLIILAQRFISKEIFYLSLKKIYSIKSNQVKEFIRSCFKIEIFYYFWCYSNISLSVIFNCFLAFEYLGLRN